MLLLPDVSKTPCAHIPQDMPTCFASTRPGDLKWRCVEVPKFVLVWEAASFKMPNRHVCVCVCARACVCVRVRVCECVRERETCM
jgi:hypothetical protein